MGSLPRLAGCEIDFRAFAIFTRDNVDSARGLVAVVNRRLIAYIAIGSVLFAAALLPFMLIFDAARPWIMLACMGLSASLLIWRRLSR